MSLAIDIDTVVKVCVAGKWHDVKFWNEEEDETVSSFHLDAYEYVTHLDPGEWPPLHTEHGVASTAYVQQGLVSLMKLRDLKFRVPLHQ